MQVEGKAESEDVRGKTQAERAFDMAKKNKLIHKYNEKNILTNKQRLEYRNKVLNKLPDHEDLFKTGEKIQKGY